MNDEQKNFIESLITMALDPKKERLIFWQDRIGVSWNEQKEKLAETHSNFYFVRLDSNYGPGSTDVLFVFKGGSHVRLFSVAERYIDSLHGFWREWLTELTYTPEKRLHFIKMYMQIPDHLIAPAITWEEELRAHGK